MKHLPIHNTTLTLSNICLGAGGFGTTISEEQTYEILDAFTDAGGNFVDTANCYGRWASGRGNCSERIIGEWLRSRKAYDRLVVGTKGGHFDLEKLYVSRVDKVNVRGDLEESLQTLGLERIELYWLHRDNEDMPIEDIVDFMEEFVKEGKIRYYGASNFKLERMKAAKAHAKKRGYQGFSAVQNRWSLASVNEGSVGDPTLVAMTDEFYEWHRETKTPAIPFSATAAGFFDKLKNNSLTEKHKERYINDKNMKIYEELLPLTGEHSLYELSLAYMLGHDFDVIPISSVRDLTQLKGLIKASGINLPKKTLDKIRGIQ